MEKKKIVILGSTGSVGTQAIEVAKNLGINVIGISCNKNIEKLIEQIKEIKPKYIAVANKEIYLQLKNKINIKDIEIFYGKEGIKKLAALKEADLVINSITGIAGLSVTLATLRAGKVLGLANKESLVVAGELIAKTVEKYGGSILPIDSEHSAIFQAIKSGTRNEVKKLILTASGGPFWGKSRAELKNVTIEDALNHPNWKMGKKITIDSATLLNKGFEIIEASVLFSIPIEQIEVVVHPQSIVHSLVEFKDNSIIAQLSVPDMKGAIAYAISYPEREAAVISELNLIKATPLEFFEVDSKTFRGIEIAKSAYLKGGLYPSVCNGASEKLVELFLCKKIKFIDIDEILENCLDNIYIDNKQITEANILWADNLGRELAQKKANELSKCI